MAFVQEVGGGIVTTAASSLLVSASTTSGNLLVACVSWRDTSITISSISDDGGNTWQVYPGATEVGTAGSGAIWYSFTSHANSTGITVHMSSTTFIAMSVQEHTGSWSVDVEAANFGTGISLSSGTTAALAGSSDLAIGCIETQAASSTNATLVSTGTGYTATTQRNSHS
jgi:hypothetical protein